jgi:Protein of unknown function (DUF3703)
MSPNRREACEAALTESRTARRGGDDQAAWAHLERAHILGQPFIGPHLRTHWEMLRLAVATRIRGEALGQVFRLVLVIPGTLLGRLPAGNTGRANVSAFVPMPIPAELSALL